MHQMSPGVERAVAGGRAWAQRLGCPAVQLTHLLLALLDEEEGRSALLVESVGIAPAASRERWVALPDSPLAPPDSILFTAARDWSLAYRHDPEFLTDAFLLAVLRANPAFERTAAGLGLDVAQLEALLIRNSTPSPPGFAGGECGGEGASHPGASPTHPNPLPRSGGEGDKTSQAITATC
jgi:thiamine-phosphate pyrophosphorylase